MSRDAGRARQHLSLGPGAERLQDVRLEDGLSDDPTGDYHFQVALRTCAGTKPSLKDRRNSISSTMAQVVTHR